MANMQAVFYRQSDGIEPVDDYIAGLLVAHQAAIDGQIDWLNRVTPDDPPLSFPHSAQVRGSLRELRCHYGNVLYRILYQRSDKLFILPHIVRKDRGAPLAADIIVAQERWNDFKARMNATSRQPPRAVGHDAP
jgi:phage-related protein